MAEQPTWQADRHNWSTAESAVFWTRDLSIFGPAELERGQTRQAEPGQALGWATVPVNGLTPDCEPVDGRCACGRSA
jgi:hypothetical protein